MTPALGLIEGYYGKPWSWRAREETIALWQEVSGKSAEDLEWYEDFTHLKMSCTAVRLGQLRGTHMVEEAGMAKRLKLDR